MKNLIPVAVIYIGVYLTLTVARSVQPQGTDVQCKDGEFYHVEFGRCLSCSACMPELVPCGSLCHGFMIFKGFSFLQQPQEKPKGFSFLQQPEEKPKADCKTKEDVPEKTPKVLNAVEEERLWRTLAFALIGIICLLVVAAAVLFFLSLNGLRYYPGWFCKTVNNDAGDDSENGYVVIHQFIPNCATPPASPSPTPKEREAESEPTHVLVKYKPGITQYNRGYKPKRRLLPESADDVFESDDSAGNRSIPLAPIPEKEDC
ncbi:uncharacterized protein LOC127874866 [Dreissena polymorpha]|uniref:Uncharacterized protein n=1 Tax=Dreissena polymorpha TaxID=45954 RepID=A0A9D4L7U0_DREPO|nr:uncharacterized protein LOC127874866 [Dreissena polymorpha]XP_052275489.1 uncharacterized protein LOC127874866 [Dreissena polymorpha]KAH3852041.1 hypothetical protein DPMN_094534 [Dreissena polymorpha]